MVYGARATTTAHGHLNLIPTNCFWTENSSLYEPSKIDEILQCEPYEWQTFQEWAEICFISNPIRTIYSQFQVWKLEHLRFNMSSPAVVSTVLFIPTNLIMQCSQLNPSYPDFESPAYKSTFRGNWLPPLSAHALDTWGCITCHVITLHYVTHQEYGR